MVVERAANVKEKRVILGETDDKSKEITKKAKRLTCSRYVAWCRLAEISNGILNHLILKQKRFKFNLNHCNHVEK